MILRLINSFFIRQWTVRAADGCCSTVRVWPQSAQAFLLEPDRSSVVVFDLERGKTSAVIGVGSPYVDSGKTFAIDQTRNRI
jgi:hypothetical protein